MIADFLLVVPARYASTRFPGKALAPLGDKSVLQRTYERCLQAVDRDRVLIATDDDRIEAHCRDIGANVVKTSRACLTGTDRVAEVAARRHADWYLNVQGDEPFVDPAAIRSVIEAAEASQDCDVVNSMARIDNVVDFVSPTVPKVVCAPTGRLLYVSRAPIPATKTLNFVSAFRQVGVYAFRRSALIRFTMQATKTAIEEIEDIEILRFLELGYSVKMVEVHAPGMAIDTPGDLERATRLLAE